MHSVKNKLLSEYEKTRSDHRRIAAHRKETEKQLKNHMERSEDCLEIRIDYDEGNKNLFKEKLNQICDIFLPHFAKADFLAMKYEMMHKAGSLLVYAFSALAVTAVTAQFIFHLAPVLILVEFMMMMAILAIILIVKKYAIHKRWIDYRLLAERFRLAIFIGLIGNENCFFTTDRNFTNNQSNSHWHYSVFNQIWQKWIDHSTKTKITPNSLWIIKTFLKNAWLSDQMSYHAKISKEKKKKHKCLTFTCTMLFFLTMIASIGHYLLHDPSHPQGYSFMGGLLTLFAISFPAIAVSFTALRDLFEYERIAEQSDEMIAQIEELEKKLDAVDTMKELFEIGKAMEILVLKENLDWYTLTSYRKPELP